MNVHIPVPVVVAKCRALTETRHARNRGPARDGLFAERAVSIVHIEVEARTAGARDVEILVAIVLDVTPRNAVAEYRTGETCRRGHVLERAVAEVAVE